MLDDKRYQKYFDQYNSYNKIYNLGNKYLSLGQEITRTKYYKLLYYPWNLDAHKQKSKIFLIIPSIFNSPEILFLARSKSFVKNLQEYGEVFLIDWLEVKDSEYLLDDYVCKVIEVINLMEEKNIVKINLIGHCIGGNLALATNLMKTEVIQSLTLLTCPWDFSHFLHSRKLQQYFALDSHVEQLPQIPKIHLQILFFLLLLNYFNTKLDKFFLLTDEIEQDLVFRIENWLMSGNDMPKTTYNQLMQQVLDNNMFAELNWRINDSTINPTLIDKPVYIVIADNDQIVPFSSILPLQYLLKNSKLIKVSGGHISYLINNQLQDLFKEYLS